MELHELEVAEHRSGPERERHPVAGGDGGVGGLREDLAQPTRGEYDGPAAHRPDSVTLALTHHVQGDSRDATVGREQEVDRECVLHDLDVGRSLDGRDEGALDLGPGRITPGVCDPVAMVPSLAGQREHAFG